MTIVTAGAGGTTQFTRAPRCAAGTAHAGSCGKLARVVIDPSMRTLTHMLAELRDDEIAVRLS